MVHEALANGVCKFGCGCRISAADGRFHAMHDDALVEACPKGLAEDDAAHLRLVDQGARDPDIPRDIALVKRTVRLGRLETHVDVTLTSARFETMVSRQHATFTWVTTGWWVVMDNASLNGVLVNGRSIPSEVPVPIRNGDHITFGNDFSDLVYAFHTVEPRCPPGRRSPRDPRRTSGGSSGSDASPAGAKPKLPGPPPASPPHTPPHPHSPGHSPGHSPAAHDGPPHGRGGYRASPPRAEPAPGGRRGSMGHFSDDDAMELRLVDPHARAAACAPRVIPLNKAQVRVGSADHREPVDVVLRSSKSPRGPSRSARVLWLCKSQWGIIDDNSGGGLLVNGVRVAPGQCTRLHPHDHVTFGDAGSDLVYEFRPLGPPGPAPHRSPRRGTPSPGPDAEPAAKKIVNVGTEGETVKQIREFDTTAPAAKI